VEDDEDQSDSVVELLRQSNLEARQAHTADEALRSLASERFGCVILDLGLPDADGLRLLQDLQARTDIWLPPIVVHTGRALSREATRQIGNYAETVVMKDGRSAERLVNEVQRFVGQVRCNLPRRDLDETEGPPVLDAALDGATILIADDDMRTVYALSALLRAKGADVVVAETGREALRLLEQHPNVRAVLMDIMMPDMDGYEAMRRVREQPRFSELPVIALTARAMKGERERCEAAGASEYMAKPLDPAGLLSTLKHWLAPKFYGERVVMSNDDQRRGRA
jgi:CheY-like chemotaxis protein